MKKFFSTFFGKLVIVVCIIMFGFMLQTATTGNLGTYGSRLIGTITVPINSVIVTIQAYIDEFLDNFQRVDILLEDNKKLRDEATSLKQQIIDYDKLKNDNNNLRDILRIQEENPNFQMVDTIVVSRDTTDKFYSFIINKGTKHGIQEKNAVINKNGLVGIVTDVQDSFAVVSTVLDPKINIGAYGSASNDNGILSGDNSLIKEKKMKLNYISRNNTLQKDDIVATSGTGQNFPRGLMVGNIEKVYLENDGLSMTAVVIPSVDVETVTQVQVIVGF
ncbi:MAG: rod shape-determining protein MreC [Oscillospiraceae bacterium]